LDLDAVLDRNAGGITRDDPHEQIVTYEKRKLGHDVAAFEVAYVGLW
jgi:hypothetical protein